MKIYYSKLHKKYLKIIEKLSFTSFKQELHFYTIFTVLLQPYFISIILFQHKLNFFKSKKKQIRSEKCNFYTQIKFKYVYTF